MRNPARFPALLWKQGKGFFGKPKTFIAFYSVFNPRNVDTLYFRTDCLDNCVVTIVHSRAISFYLSIFRKPYFIGRFLPALLTPRKVCHHLFLFFSLFLAQTDVLKTECGFTNKTATQMRNRKERGKMMQILSYYNLNWSLSACILCLYRSFINLDSYKFYLKYLAFFVTA